MAKLFIKAKNENGKQIGLGANKTLDIDIVVGNKVIAEMILMESKTEGGFTLYVKRGERIATLRTIKTGQKTQA